ncbi:MAG: NAD-dependent epimerase/dehydratase family protein, partial [Phycisphaerales bacterium]
MAVTGGAGFIGSHLADALVALGADVTLLDDLSNGRGANLCGAAAQARLVRGSSLDAAALDEALAGAELVFHQAARGSVPQSIEAPLDYLETNVAGTIRVMEACRRHHVRRSDSQASFEKA